MSMKTLPLVFINLGGEMLYILDHRLQAHSTSEGKSEKEVWSENDRKRVMNDIVGTMFSKAFVDELLKPQLLYSHRTMKVVLTRLAHVSIMKLKTVSMEKLYELMIMAFKYQVFHCPRPKDLLLISYNHIDTIREFVKDTPALVNKVDETHRKIIEVYSSMTSGEFQLLRQTLLTFLQDMHIRVSIFLKNKIQNPNGRFALSTSGPVPHGMDVPGIIRIFDNKGRQMQQSRFSSGGSYTLPIKDASFGLHGDRVIKLGVNMYSVNMGGESSKVHSVKTETAPNLLAKEELNLLARLMGTVEIENVSASQIGFQINLFNSAQEEDEGGASGGAEESFGVINIQALQDEHSATQLAQIAGLFAEQEEMPDDVNSNKGDDLLAMMDDL
ncbi:protein OSCP1a isoform X1 [Phycodurus eques]|uniref:protein OSCP1a isoform X1 n=2 Tax=Phycodurus eques TaxID=693459 RepID=UPI002ACDA2F4|nr:protein OSCP1a isoform X1 [Phycodurus eques]XP_061520582.1 protein OSCP1a isoform X1 [Phycodurus eques]